MTERLTKDQQRRKIETMFCEGCEVRDMKITELESENKALNGVLGYSTKADAMVKKAHEQLSITIDALKKIAFTEYMSYLSTSSSSYSIGVTDGHRIAAQWARYALTSLEKESASKTEAGE